MGENDRFFLTSFQADLQIVELVVVCGDYCTRSKGSLLSENAIVNVAGTGSKCRDRPFTQVTNNPLDRINCLAAFFQFCEAQFTHICFLIDEITPVSTGLPRES